MKFKFYNPFDYSKVTGWSQLLKISWGTTQVIDIPQLSNLVMIEEKFLIIGFRKRWFSWDNDRALGTWLCLFGVMFNYCNNLGQTKSLFKKDKHI